MSKPIYDYYISGPMTGYPDFNYPAFHAKAKELRDKGHMVFNPAEMFDGQHDLPREKYMREDIAALLDTENIIFLDGWSKSRGAVLEYHVAFELGLFLHYPINEPPIADELFYHPSKSQDTETILDEAKRLVYGDRNKDYGDPSDDFENIAAKWSVTFGIPVTKDMVGLAMIDMKTCRHMHRRKRDNLVDIAGYAACLERCE